MTTAYAPRRPATTVLTTREVQLLTLASYGHTNDDIAAQLAQTTASVSYVLGRTYAKLGATGRAHAVSLALRTGVIA